MTSDDVEYGVRMAIQNCVADGTLGALIESTLTDVAIKVVKALSETDSDGGDPIIQAGLREWAKKIQES